MADLVAAVSVVASLAEGSCHSESRDVLAAGTGGAVEGSRSVAVDGVAGTAAVASVPLLIVSSCILISIHVTYLLLAAFVQT